MVIRRNMFYSDCVTAQIIATGRGRADLASLTGPWGADQTTWPTVGMALGYVGRAGHLQPNGAVREMLSGSNENFVGPIKILAACPIKWLKLLELKFLLFFA